MIWKNCTLLRAVTEKDALDNEVETGEFDTVVSSQARFTPWSVEEIAMLGLDVTKNTQKYAVPIPYSWAKTATHVTMDGTTLRIKDVIDLAPRWTLFTVEVYRV